MQNEVNSLIKDLKKLLGGWAWVRFWKTIQSSQQRTDTFGEPLGFPVIKPGVAGSITGFSRTTFG